MGADSTHEAAEAVLEFARNALDDLLADDNHTLTAYEKKQLRAVLDENAGMRKERAELGDAEFQRRIIAPDGQTLAPSAFDLANRDLWLPGLRLEQRTVYGTPWVNADLHNGGDADA